MVATTFGQMLEARLRHSPGRPLLTYYDDATGERTELSVTTYANWVAKTAGVLVDDLDLATGDLVAIDLPPHWLGPVFLGAAWLAGLEVVGATALGSRTGATDLVVQGPHPSPRPARLRLGCALLPFAVPAREPLGEEVLDFGTLWPGQPDAFLGMPANAEDVALDGLDQESLLERARQVGYRDGERVQTDLNPASGPGLDVFLGVLASAGSIVLLARPDQTSWSGRAASEHVTREVRA